MTNLHGVVEVAEIPALSEQELEEVGEHIIALKQSLLLEHYLKKDEATAFEMDRWSDIGGICLQI